MSYSWRCSCAAYARQPRDGMKMTRHDGHHYVNSHDLFWSVLVTSE